MTAKACTYGNCGAISRRTLAEAADCESGMVETPIMRRHLDSFVFYIKSEFLPGGDDHAFLGF